MYQNRLDAGRRLAKGLSRFRGSESLLVLGLPRGGVPVAKVVAEALDAELDVCLVRKLGLPWQPELAMGAVAEGGIGVLDAALIEAAGISKERIDALKEQAHAEIRRRAALYRKEGTQSPVRGRTVIVVDDGLATGATMMAAVRTLRAGGAGRIIAAVPVGPASTCEVLRAEADEVICLETPEPFDAVGRWYEDFAQVEDSEVEECLASARKRAAR